MLRVANYVITIVNSTINSGLIDPTKDQYSLCLLISTLAFGKEKDRQGVPYVQHGLRLSNNPLVKDNELAQCVCLLHDVIEDTDLTKSDLLGIGVNPVIVDLVEVLTHKSNQNYEDYIENIIYQSEGIKSGYILILVKMSDIEDNSIITRNYTETNEDKIIKRHLKYMKAYGKLRSHYHETYHHY